MPIKLLSTDQLGPAQYGFEVGMWDLIVLIPDHCLSAYLQYGVEKSGEQTLNDKNAFIS